MGEQAAAAAAAIPISALAALFLLPPPSHPPLRAPLAPFYCIDDDRDEGTDTLSTLNGWHFSWRLFSFSSPPAPSSAPFRLVVAAAAASHKTADCPILVVRWRCWWLTSEANATPLRAAATAATAQLMGNVLFVVGTFSQSTRRRSQRHDPPPVLCLSFRTSTSRISTVDAVKSLLFWPSQQIHPGSVNSPLHEQLRQQLLLVDVVRVLIRFFHQKLLLFSLRSLQLLEETLYEKPPDIIGADLHLGFRFCNAGTTLHSFLRQRQFFQ